MMGFTIINTTIMLIFFGIWIYCFVLFIRLAHRGIKALDIYIKKNEDIH
ncbi:hypothetical protein [Caloranaerobacter sp. DY30410]